MVPSNFWDKPWKSVKRINLYSEKTTWQQPPMGYSIFCRKLVCIISPCIVSHNHKTFFCFLSRKYFTQHSMYAIFHQLFGWCRRKEYKVEVAIEEFWALFLKKQEIWKQIYLTLGHLSFYHHATKLYLLWSWRLVLD